MRKTLAVALGLMATSFGIGCTATPKTAAHSHDPSDHNHDRGHMMIASNGVIDALLTAHLSSKTGNELDVFVEKNGAPVALDTTELPLRRGDVAYVWRGFEPMRYAHHVE